MERHEWEDICQEIGARWPAQAKNMTDDYLAVGWMDLAQFSADEVREQVRALSRSGHEFLPAVGEIYAALKPPAPEPTIVEAIALMEEVEIRTRGKLPAGQTVPDFTQHTEDDRLAFATTMLARTIGWSAFCSMGGDDWQRVKGIMIGQYRDYFQGLVRGTTPRQAAELRTGANVHLFPSNPKPMEGGADAGH